MCWFFRDPHPRLLVSRGRLGHPRVIIGFDWLLAKEKQLHRFASLLLASPIRAAFFTVKHRLNQFVRLITAGQQILRRHLVIGLQIRIYSSLTATQIDQQLYNTFPGEMSECWRIEALLI